MRKCVVEVVDSACVSVEGRANLQEGKANFKKSSPYPITQDRHQILSNKMLIIELGKGAQSPECGCIDPCPVWPLKMILCSRQHAIIRSNEGMSNFYDHLSCRTSYPIIPVATFILCVCSRNSWRVFISEMRNANRKSILPRFNLKCFASPVGI